MILTVDAAEETLLQETLLEETRIKEAYERRKVIDNRYSLFNPGQLFMVQSTERRLLSLLQESGCADLTTKYICEVGCGTGYWLRAMLEWGAQPERVTGIDLLPERVALARERCPAGMDIRCGNASHLNFPDASFDIVLQATVFSSILDPEMKRSLAIEMLRITKPDGIVLWYDYHTNNPWNHDVRGVKKKEIKTLFPQCEIKLQRTTLVPPLVRGLAPYSWLSCSVLETLPFLRTHYLGVIRKSV